MTMTGERFAALWGSLSRSAAVRSRTREEGFDGGQVKSPARLTPASARYKIPQWMEATMRCY